MNNDLKIAQAAVLEDIYTIADKAGIDRKYLIPYGNDKAKVSLKIADEIGDRPDGKLILVTAINPTKLPFEGFESDTFFFLCIMMLRAENVLSD